MARALRWDLREVRLFGVPLPRSWFRVEARESADGGLYRFRARVDGGGGSPRRLRRHPRPDAVKVLVLGAYGNFGAVICAALASLPGVEVIVARRDARRARALASTLGCASVALDAQDPALASRLAGAGVVWMSTPRDRSRAPITGWRAQRSKPGWRT